MTGERSSSSGSCPPRAAPRRARPAAGRRHGRSCLPRHRRSSAETSYTSAFRSPRCQPLCTSFHASTSSRVAVAKNASCSRWWLAAVTLAPTQPQPCALPQHSLPHELQWRVWRECSARPWQLRPAALCPDCARRQRRHSQSYQALYLISFGLQSQCTITYRCAIPSSSASDAHF